MTGSAGKEKLSLCLGDLSMCSPKIQGGGGDQEHSVVSWEEHSAMFELKRISATALSAKAGMGTAGWRGSEWDALKDVKGVSSLSSCSKSPPYKRGVKQGWIHSQAQGCEVPLIPPGNTILCHGHRPWEVVPLVGYLPSGPRLSRLEPQRSFLSEEIGAEAEGAVCRLGSHHSHG